MPNSIKYSTTGDTLSLKKGNIFFGVGDVPKGPSNITQHYNGVTPQSGSYMVYFYDPAQPNNIGFDPVSSDPALVEYTNRMFGTTFTSASQCLAWYSTQPNRSCVNKDYESIVTNGLVLNLDAGFLPSYPTSGTTWYDMGYSGNNGTLTNGPSYSSLEGGYINFDGTNDYVSCGNPTNLQITQGTISAWVKTSTPGSDFRGIIVKQRNYGIFIRNGILTTYDWGAAVERTTSINIADGTWKNIAMTFTTNTGAPSNNAIIYLNGVAVLTTTIKYDADTVEVQIGNGGIATQYINGNISQAKIYNRALSAAEVLQNYNVELSRYNTSNIVKSNLLFNLDSSNTVSYPTSGTTWTDLGGYGNTGTLINGPTFNSTSKSIVFDGTNDYWQYSSRTTNTEFQYYDAFTVESMVYVNENTSTGYIVTNRADKDGNNTSYAGWGIAQYEGYINASIGGYPSFVLDWRVARISASTFNDIVYRKWCHITWVNTGVAGQQKIYLNGVDRTSAAYDDATPPYVINYNGTQKITVGMSPADGTPGGWFLDGSIDTVRIYNKALSQSEVIQNYYGGPIVTSGMVMSLDAGNLVSYSGTGTTWRDLTSNGYIGTLTNGPTYSTDGGGTIVFDGVDDYVDVSNPANLQNQNFTISIWVNPSSATNAITAIVDYDHASLQGWVVQSEDATTNRYFYFGYYDGSAFQPATGIGVGKGVQLTNSVWQNLTYTKNGTSIVGYLNGSQIFTSTAGNGNVSYQANKTLRIGNTVSTSGRNYNGKFSSTQIYNRVLTADEVAQNFNAYKTRFGL